MLDGLQTLYFKCVNVQEGKVLAVADVLKQVPAMNDLILLFFELSEEHFRLLAHSVGGLSALQTLYLDFGDIMDYASKSKPLSSEIKGCKESCSSSSLVALGSIVCDLTCLTELRFKALPMSYTGSEALAQKLGCLTALQTLSLNDMSLGERGGVALAPVIGTLTCLKYLCLTNNELTCDAVKCLSDHIKNLVTLQRLDVKENEIGNRGVWELAALVRTVPALASITLDGN